MAEVIHFGKGFHSIAPVVMSLFHPIEVQSLVFISSSWYIMLDFGYFQSM